MGLAIMSAPAVTRFVIGLLLVLSSCASPVSGGNGEGFPKFKFEDREQYAVDSNNYPTFRIERSIYRPPPSMFKGVGGNTPNEEIRTTDLWRVRYVYGGYYYIFSNEYQKRQEQVFKQTGTNDIVDYYLYHLPIDKTGKVMGGWVSFKNKKIVLLPSDRRVVFDPNYWRNPEWDKQPRFRPVEK